MSKAKALAIAWMTGILTGLACVALITLIALWANTPELAGLGGVVAGFGSYVVGTAVYDKLYY